jgi:hypothetical protein
MVRDQARSKVYGSRHLSSSNLRTPTGRQSVDLSKISKGGQVFAGASLVYVIASFLPWYTADVPAELAGFGLSDYSTSAWGDLGFLWGAIWALLLLVGAVLLVLPAFGVTAPKLPTVAYLAVAALAALFQGVRWRHRRPHRHEQAQGPVRWWRSRWRHSPAPAAAPPA